MIGSSKAGPRRESKQRLRRGGSGDGLDGLRPSRTVVEISVSA